MTDLVIKINSNEISIIEENENEVVIQASAGVIWHELVLYCVERNYGGIENLSLIPGTVGAAPIQNIGAYGQELKDTFKSLKEYLLIILKKKFFRKMNVNLDIEKAFLKTN